MQLLIVEDEMLMAKSLQKLVAEVEPTARIMAITQSVEETVGWLKSHPAPDVILMDIELADGQSFDIFQQTEVKAPVIFTTAYDEFAIKAFKVNSIDYLLKPVKEGELKQAFHKYKAAKLAAVPDGLHALLAEIKRLQQPSGYRERFLVKQGQRLHSIETSEIAYLFSENGFSFLRTKQGLKYIVDYSLDELEASLPPKEFFRVNRQYILSNSCIAGIHTWFNQKLKVDVSPPTGEPIVISRDKAPAFREWMGE